MTKLNDLQAKWMKEPACKQAYDALEEEFALASALLVEEGGGGNAMALELVVAALGLRFPNPGFDKTPRFPARC